MSGMCLNGADYTARQSQSHNQLDVYCIILGERSGLTRVTKSVQRLEHQANCLFAIVEAE
jgi:hypothetical protein